MNGMYCGENGVPPPATMAERRRIERVGHVVLVQVVGFERDVPLVVELVIVRQAVPLQVVVAPLAAIDAVGDEIDVVVAAVAGPAHAER